MSNEHQLAAWRKLWQILLRDGECLKPDYQKNYGESSESKSGNETVDDASTAPNQ